MEVACGIGTLDEDNDENSLLAVCKGSCEAISWGVVDPEFSGDSDLYK